MITWDEPKRLANIDKHGLDFAELSAGFFLEAAITPARKGRYKAVGFVNGKMVAVIFAPLGTEAVSVISMRPTKKQERRFL